MILFPLTKAYEYMNPYDRNTTQTSIFLYKEKSPLI